MHDLGERFERVLLEATGASGFRVSEVIQSGCQPFGRDMTLRLQVIEKPQLCRNLHTCVSTHVLRRSKQREGVHGNHRNGT